MPDDRAYLRDCFLNLRDRPLEVGDPFYVPIYGTAVAEFDPVAEIANVILFHAGTGRGSAHLFSGFVGSGKSTELRRLRGRLHDEGVVVLLCNMSEYLNTTTAIDISDLLLAMAGALSEQVALELGADPTHESYWRRFSRWWRTTRVTPEEVSSKLGFDEAGLEVKLSLKEDPSFKKLVQEHLAGRIGAFVSEVRAFFAECLQRVRTARGEDCEFVVLFDQLETLQGTSTNADMVQESVERVFGLHWDKLRFEDIHVLYTVPPWLKIRAGGLGTRFDSFVLLPCIKIEDDRGASFDPGRELLSHIVALRLKGEPDRILLPADLARLVAGSGGYVRELLRMAQKVITKGIGRPLPVASDVVGVVLDEVRNEYLPLSDEDIAWLRHVRASKTAQHANAAALPRLAMFFQNHLVMAYRNGHEWYDVHPLLVPELQRAGKG